MASITCGNCKKTHSSVEVVKACYAGAPTITAEEMARQIVQSEYDKASKMLSDSAERREGRPAQIRNSGGVRFVPEPLFEDEPDEQSNPTVVYVPATEPGASTRNKNDQTIPGFYKVDGFVYKVTPARSSDRTFAHQLQEQIPNEAPEWKYMGLAKRFVPMYADKLTLADAKLYGTTHGYCMICGRLLTAEQSVADGIGPICAGKL